MMRKNLLLLLAVVFVLSGCLASKPKEALPTESKAQRSAATSEVTSPTSDWPTVDWLTSTPEEQDMDGEILAQMLAAIKQQNLDLHSMLVIRHGRLVSETYFGSYTQKHKHELYSCTKSFIATLVGIALEQGKISGIEEKAVNFFPDKSFENSDERKQAMTLENLLTMTSGLTWEDGDPAFRALYTSSDWVKHVMDLPMSEAPGEIFNYCSGCSHVLSGIIRQQTGLATQKYAEEKLFGQLGIKDYAWSMDATGNAIGGWGLQLTPRQMAKLGYLYLHQGNWDGQQLVPAAWVEQSTQAHVQTGKLPHTGYGYQWWVFPELGGYAALGLGGQTIFVAPDFDLVVVTTAKLDGHEEIFELLDKYILPAAGQAP